MNAFRPPPRWCCILPNRIARIEVIYALLKTAPGSSVIGCPLVFLSNEHASWIRWVASSSVGALAEALEPGLALVGR